MAYQTTNIRQRLKSCELPELFIEELGWNHHRTAPLIVETDGTNYKLTAIAEKHGMVAYLCDPGPMGDIPDYCIRGKIERQVMKSAHEHIIVFVNAGRSAQTWQWVRRERSRPAARREHTYINTQPGDSLIQKLKALAVSLDEEEKLTIVDVAGKVRQAFDVDRVTKRFFERFKDEHSKFLDFIEGITSVADREWYASLMLNRLMFIYFIQKKSFLDGDINYLRNRLKMVRERSGRGKFHSFYRYFLLRLFHQGLALRREDRPAELDSLLGKVPYLNGGLFDTHQLEQDNPTIHIPDEAFERLFDFFDAYQWHLEERPMRADDEINPDVLGYIFEKYINQKQMGAYYTREDITEYIGKSTIVPFLFDAAEKKRAIAFRPDGEVWRLLCDDPDRYIYESVRRGVNLPLPDEIAAGVTVVARRGGWNRPADEGFALPTETWREHVARRTRCLELRAKLSAGEIHSINDLITYNLDLRQFAQDVIETCEGPELLRAFWKSIENLSVLDPTCGSGAFLFAALNILEPLYDACLNRMEIFVEELDRSGGKHHPEKFSDFRKTLEHANDKSKHPSRRYFILKSIVLRNLYGVDIMNEAVEICKLRLFLKLVAQVERVDDVEPLPDIDFNIRAGNTLVGFTSLEQLRQAMTMNIRGQRRLPDPLDEEILESINEDAELADKAFQRFRQQQSELGMDAASYSDSKIELRRKLATLANQLDRYLGTQYGIDINKQGDFNKWQESHQPFHWFTEFYGAMNDGGFDVIIGNPPYVEYTKVKDAYTIHDYKTKTCGNLYAFMIERSFVLFGQNGRFGMIVPLSLVSTDRMDSLQSFIIQNQRSIWLSLFDVYPCKLFEGSKQRLTIFMASGKQLIQAQIFTTRYNRWKPEERAHLLQKLSYWLSWHDQRLSVIPKIQVSITESILSKLAKKELAMYEDVGIHTSFYVHRIPYNYVKAFDFIPYFWNEVDGEKKSEDYKPYCLRQSNDERIVLAVLNSNLFFWWWYTLFEGYHCGKHEIYAFPIGLKSMSSVYRDLLSVLATKLMDEIVRNKNRKTAQYKNTGTVVYDEFYPKHSKSIIDEIDRALAKHYGFTDEELDFIINYDIKYRMGQDSQENDDSGA